MRDRCANCGDIGAHSHHCLPRSMAPSERTTKLNLIWLCPACHDGWHQGTVTLHRTIFTPEQWGWLASHAPWSWLNRWYPPRPQPF